jgi:putative heme-binding domain-containing protein
VGIALGADALSIYICDWNHRDTKANVTVGRLLKLRYTGKSHATPSPTNLVHALSHPARSVRLAAQRQLKADVLDHVEDEPALWHAIWLSTNVASCLKDERPSVRRQALRRNVLPAAEVRKYLGDRDASVRFQAATVLGKIGSTPEIVALQQLLADSDSVVRYATFTALNQIGRRHPESWLQICQGLNDSRIGEATQYALRDTYDLSLVKALRAIATPEAVRLLAGIHHKKPEWKGEWWAYHPFRTTPPSKTVPWEGTALILKTLRASLTNPDPVVVQALAEARDSESISVLRKLLEDNPGTHALRALLNAAASLRIQTPALIRYASHIDGAVRSNALNALIAVDRDAAFTKILPLLKHSDGPIRASAVTALGRLKNKAALDPLLGAYWDPSTRNEAIVALAQTPDIKAIDAYVDGLTQTNVSVRESARQAVRAIRNEARPLLAQRPELAKEMRLIFGSQTPGSPEDYLREGLGLAGKGAAANGQKLFSKLCVQCHTVRGEGGKVGPDMTTVGAQFSRREIAESILYPSKAVREGYQSMNVETKDNESFSGLLKGETADELTLVDAAGQLQRVPKTQIAFRTLSDLSLMPEGLHSALTLSEFSDLLAYLETLR